MTLSDLDAVLAELDRFWGGRDMRFLHQRVLIREFGGTCLAAHGPEGHIAGYVIGFTTPRRVGYIHAVAVRGDARRAGCARALYHEFAAAAAAEGADRLKAVTTAANTGSIAFHRRLGFLVEPADGYGSPDEPMVMMTRPLPMR